MGVRVDRLRLVSQPHAPGQLRDPEDSRMDRLLLASVLIKLHHLALLRTLGSGQKRGGEAVVFGVKQLVWSPEVYGGRPRDAWLLKLTTSHVKGMIANGPGISPGF